MKSNRKRARRISWSSNKRAVSTAISSVIMAAAVITVGFSVLSWTFTKSADYNQLYATKMQSNLNKINEKLVFEFISFNRSRSELSIYLLNCGQSNNVSLSSVNLGNNSWHQSFSNITLVGSNNSNIQNLNVYNQGHIKLTVNLQTNLSYSINVLTARGRDFNFEFVA
jgi:hypothetical protein